MPASGPGPLQDRRILIIVENLPVPFDRRVWQEAGALRDAGAAVTVICPVGKSHEETEQVIDGIRILRHPLPFESSNKSGYILEYSSALFHEMRLAIKVLFSSGFDVIHACNPPDLIFLVAAGFKLIGKKFVFDHHDICPELYEAKYNHRGTVWKILKALERLTFWLADISIATNESYRQIAIGRGGMAAEDVFVVRSGPDLRRVRSTPPDPSLRHGRPYLVGYVGVIGEQEGLDLLLASVDNIVRDRGRRDIHFMIMGGGPNLAEVKALATRLEVDPFVTFTGRVPDDALFTALSTADVCVNPDRVNEMNDKSTMNKILEYMALAKPIVQFDVTEGRYSAGEASLYAKANDPVDFAQKICDLVDDPERRARMGAFGRERVFNEMAWEYEAPKLVSAYRRLFRI
jgi:glycosyltransferase involved in cell wall biosynthesis